MRVRYFIGLCILGFFILITDANAQLVRDLQKQETQNTSSVLVTSPGSTYGSSFLSAVLDNPHFNMSHSYSFEYNSLMNNTVGEYVNTMTYDFNFPLSIRADIGVMHQPFGASDKQMQYGLGSDAFTGIYLKNASLLYQPTDNLWMSISVQQYNPYNYNPFYHYQNHLNRLR